MRKKIIGLFVIAGFACTLLVWSQGIGHVVGQQPGGKKGGGKKGGGGAAPAQGDPFGGNAGFIVGGGGAPGGGGGGKKGGKGGGAPGGMFGGAPGGGRGNMFDPDTIFDTLSANGDTLLISKAGMLQGKLQAYADQNGITSGIITREDFQDFSKSMMTQLQKGGLAGANGKIDPDQAAAQAFQRADKNMDGFLSEDEMPPKLKPVWQRYDLNGDGLIDLEEFKMYFRETVSNTGAAGAVVDVLEQWDALPQVYRAGNLPKELPAWFMQYDRDKDGQVGMWEWVNAGRQVEEFIKMDRNGDGLLTAEEVMWYYKLSPSLGGSLGDQPTAVAVRPSFGLTTGPGADFGGGKKGKGGPGGGGKKGGGGPGGGGNADPNNPWGGFGGPGGGGPGGGGGKGGKKGGKGGGGFGGGF